VKSHQVYAMVSQKRRASTLHEALSPNLHAAQERRGMVVALGGMAVRSRRLRQFAPA